MFMVDSSGFGSPGEPALTFDQLTAYIEREDRGRFGWAIRESGQFQVVIGVYVEDPGSPGVPAPEVEPCDYCHAIHGPMDECQECDHEYRVEDIADGVVGGGAAHVYVRVCRICGEQDEDDEPEPEEWDREPVEGQTSLFA